MVSTLMHAVTQTQQFVLRQSTCISFLYAGPVCWSDCLQKEVSKILAII